MSRFKPITDDLKLLSKELENLRRMKRGECEQVSTPTRELSENGLNEECPSSKISIETNRERISNESDIKKIREKIKIEPIEDYKGIRQNDSPKYQKVSNTNLVLERIRNISLPRTKRNFSSTSTPCKNDSSFNALHYKYSELEETIKKPETSKEILKEQIMNILESLDQDMPYTERASDIKPPALYLKNIESAGASPSQNSPHSVAESYFLNKNYSSLASHLRKQEETKILIDDEIDNMKHKISELKVNNAVKLENEKIRNLKLQSSISKVEKDPQISALIEVYEDEIWKLEKNIQNLRADLIKFCEEVEKKNPQPTTNKHKTIMLIQTIKTLQQELQIKEMEIYNLKKHDRIFTINRKTLEITNSKVRQLQNKVTKKSSILKECESVHKESEDTYNAMKQENLWLKTSLEKAREDCEFLMQELKSLKETSSMPKKSSLATEDKKAIFLIDRLEKAINETNSAKAADLIRCLKNEIENIYIDLHNKKEQEQNLLDMLVDMKSDTSSIGKEINRKLRKDLLSLI
ncbi:unnamed protein product [Blepharisma stoltei]|uniref:Centrosomal protein of 162 kDa n=1 Tax=Blepharisma stoltei TaxID=1481888 RepID=A0AAU9J4J0_9CILI|nr:unnamed protein product [Blepharisma stoltei]